MSLILDAAKAQDLVVTWNTSRCVKTWDATQGQQTAEHLIAMPPDSLLGSDSKRIFTDGNRIFLLGLKMMPIEDEDESESENEKSSLARLRNRFTVSRNLFLQDGLILLTDKAQRVSGRPGLTCVSFFDGLRSTCIDWSAQCVYANGAELFGGFALDGSLSVTESFYGMLPAFTSGCNSSRYVAMVQGNDRVNVYGPGDWKRPIEVVGINFGEILSPRAAECLHLSSATPCLQSV